MNHLLRTGLLVTGVFCCAETARGEFVVVARGEPQTKIQIDARNTAGAGKDILFKAAAWLAEAVEQSSGAKLSIAEDEIGNDASAIVLARADTWPEIARDAGFQSDAFDA